MPDPDSDAAKKRVASNVCPKPGCGKYKGHVGRHRTVCREPMQTEEGGIYVQTEAKDDTTKVWDLRSVNWHADESSDFQQSGHYHTAAGNADAQAKAESQSYHPVTWGNVFA